MKKILVIEDNDIALEVISESLAEFFKADILLAINVKQAIQVIKEDQIDFIICDYELPDGTGREVLDYLIKNKFQIPMIIFSGYLNFSLKKEFPLVSIIRDKNFETLLEEIKKYSKIELREQF